MAGLLSRHGIVTTAEELRHLCHSRLLAHESRYRAALDVCDGRAALDACDEWKAVLPSGHDPHYFPTSALVVTAPVVAAPVVAAPVRASVVSWVDACGDGATELTLHDFEQQSEEGGDPDMCPLSVVGDSDSEDEDGSVDGEDDEDGGSAAAAACPRSCL